MIGRLSGSVPATKESPLATSKAMVVSIDVAKIGKNIPSGMECNSARMEWNGEREKRMVGGRTFCYSTSPEVGYDSEQDFSQPPHKKVLHD